MRGFSSREHQEMSFGARGAVFGLASTRGCLLVLAEVIGLAGASA